MITVPATISRHAFDVIRSLVLEHVGIELGENKRALVVGRLSRRLRELGLDSFDAYVDRLHGGRGDEFEYLVSALTTHVTSFFRQGEQFDVVREVVRQGLERGEVCLWSAGCSTGEEAWSLAIVVLEVVGERRLLPGTVRILATDVSGAAVEAARAGVYDRRSLQDVPPARRRRWFERAGRDTWRVQPALRRLVTFAQHNLAGEWPMRGPFDAILCRNVLIYFHPDVRARVLDGFHARLAHGGLLLLGASEGVGEDARFVMVRPSIYRRAA